MADDQPTRVSHWRLVREPALVTREIVTHDWKGEGTADDPYLIDFIPNDPRNPVSNFKRMSCVLNGHQPFLLLLEVDHESSQRIIKIYASIVLQFHEIPTNQSLD